MVTAGLIYLAAHLGVISLAPTTVNTVAVGVVVTETIGREIAKDIQRKRQEQAK